MAKNEMNQDEMMENDGDDDDDDDDEDGSLRRGNEEEERKAQGMVSEGTFKTSGSSDGAEDKDIAEGSTDDSSFPSLSLSPSLSPASSSPSLAAIPEEEEEEEKGGGSHSGHFKRFRSRPPSGSRKSRPLFDPSILKEDDGAQLVGRRRVGGVGGEGRPDFVEGVVEEAIPYEQTLLRHLKRMKPDEDEGARTPEDLSLLSQLPPRFVGCFQRVEW